jgi:hypothetical protein
MLKQFQTKTLNFTRSYVEEKRYPKKLLKKAESFLKSRWHKNIENSKIGKKFEKKIETAKPSDKNLSQVEKFHAGKRKGKTHLEAIVNKVLPPHVEMVWILEI